MNKQDAIARLDALDAEAKALRAIIEAEPKKEPRVSQLTEENVWSPVVVLLNH